MTTVYRSDDASAPTLTRELNSFSDLLQAILVDGYGAKSGAGWTTKHTAVGKKVFENASGLFFRVDDSFTHSGYYGIAECSIFETITDIDTGTGACPNTAVNSQIQSDKYWFEYRSTASTTLVTPYPWICVADDKTLYISISSTVTDTGSTGTPDFFKDSGFISEVFIFWVGEFDSYLNTDGYPNFIGCFNGQSADTTPTNASQIWGYGSSTLRRYLAIQRGANRTTLGAAACPIPYNFEQKVEPGRLAFYNAGIRSDLTYDYTSDMNSQYMYSPTFLSEYIDSNILTTRGKLRGVYDGPFHNNIASYSGKTITVDGKTLIGIRVTSGNGFWIDTGVW